MGGMEACIDVRREIRVLAWVAGAEVLLAVMFQFYPHGPQLGTDPLSLGYLFGRWMCAVEAVALVRQVATWTAWQRNCPAWTAICSPSSTA